MSATSLNRAPHRGADALRGVAALIALVVFLVGVPIALVALASAYLPADRSLAGLQQLVTGPDNGTLLFAVLALIAWLAWAAFALAVLVEVASNVRRVRTPSIPTMDAMQRAAGRLVATAGVLFALSTTALVHAQAASAVQPAAAPRAVAPTALAARVEAAATQTAPALSRALPRHEVERLPVVTVQRGDTLWGIAERHLGSGARYSEIRDLNLGRAQPDGRTLVNADWILPGWTLRLPADATNVPDRLVRPATATQARQVTVQPGDTLWDVAAAHLGDGARYREIFDLNRDSAQPNGQALHDPNLIEPGWTLLLPDADSPARAARPPQAATGGQSHVEAPAPPDHRLDAIPLSRPAEETRHQMVAEQPDAASAEPSTNEQEHAETRAWFLGLTALGAAGVLGELARRRFLQQRSRCTGETIPMPAPRTPAAAAERTLHAAATPVSIQAITTTLTNLACRCYDGDRDLPRVGAILLDEYTLTLILTEDAPEPVEPFRADGPKRWTATTADVATERPIDDPEAVDPYPLLVTLGHTSGGTLLVNLEAAGTLVISGEGEPADEVLRALVVEAATSELSGRLAVVVDDELAKLAGAFEPHRLRPGDIRAEILATATAVQRYLRDQGLDDTLEARADRQAPDTWLPTTFVTVGPGEASAAWSGLALITTARPDGPVWTITVTHDSDAHLDPLDIGFQPQRLSRDDMAALRGLLGASVPPSATGPGDHPSTSATATTTALRAAMPESESAPSPPTARVIVRVLGPIEFDGLAADTGSLSPRMQELLVYLALHGPTTGPDLDDVLWNGARISAGTRNALVYRTRLKVGEDALPRLEGGRYALGPSITTDWTLFQQHVARAVHSDDDAARLDELTAALALVNDRPLRGIAGGAFTWADLDIQLMCSAVADAALLLGHLLHAHGRDLEALDASARGLRAEPYSEPLQALFVIATEATAGTDAAMRARLNFVESSAALDAEAL